MPTIWLIGDSTVDPCQPPVRGWGWALPDYAAPGVTVANWARAGRSSRSFREEGLFQPVQQGMQPGDLLLIQFGHNDELDDPACHTDPDTTFPDMLAWYCDEAEKRGVLPVLVTSVSRSYFFPDIPEMLYTHGEYPAAVRRVARERGLPLVELKKRSRALFLSLGQEETLKLFACYRPGEHPDYPNGRDDRTHLNEHGARRIAELVAQELRRDDRTRPFVQ